jgi:hypothetical protein
VILAINSYCSEKCSHGAKCVAETFVRHYVMP